MTDRNEQFTRMPDLEFANLGNGMLAYIRPISPEIARQFAGPAFAVPSGIQLYGLFSADGTPLAISDNQNSALASAFEHELNPMRVH